MKLLNCSGALKSGQGLNAVNSTLASLNIPGMSSTMYKRYESETEISTATKSKESGDTGGKTEVQ